MDNNSNHWTSPTLLPPCKKCGDKRVDSMEIGVRLATHEVVLIVTCHGQMETKMSHFTDVEWQAMPPIKPTELYGDAFEEKKEGELDV